MSAEFGSAVHRAMELRHRFLNGDSGVRDDMLAAAQVACDLFNERAQAVAKRQGRRAPARMSVKRFMLYMDRIKLPTGSAPEGVNAAHDWYWSKDESS